MPRRSKDLSAREVFEILAREHADMLAGFLSSLVRSRDGVDDLFQETMLTAWRRLDRYDRTQPFGPWLRGIAANLVLRHRERAARDFYRFEPRVLEELEDSYAELVPAPPQWSATLERLAHCLDRLSDTLRTTLALVYERGLAVRAAAAELGDAEEAVKKRLQRGRQRLAECLRTGGTS